jgi:hypothetical protein
LMESVGFFKTLHNWRYLLIYKDSNNLTFVCKGNLKLKNSMYFV